MPQDDLPAFCFYQEFEPRPAETLSFERHYLMYCIKGAISLPPFKLSIRPITSAFGHTPQSIFEYVAVLV